MSAVMITGCSGAGKTTIAPLLARRGLASIDADDDPLLSRFVDPPAPSWNPRQPRTLPGLPGIAGNGIPARLDQLIGAVAPATLYVCGYAANQLELADRFTLVFLLEIDDPTMLARLDAPNRDNDWGRTGDTREFERRWLPGTKTACAHSARFPSTPHGPPARWWTRYSPTRWLGPPRAKPASWASSPAVPPDPGNRQALPEDDPSTISWT